MMWTPRNGDKLRNTVSPRLARRMGLVLLASLVLMSLDSVLLMPLRTMLMTAEHGVMVVLREEEESTSNSWWNASAIAPLATQQKPPPLPQSALTATLRDRQKDLGSGWAWTTLWNSSRIIPSSAVDNSNNNNNNNSGIDNRTITNDTRLDRCTACRDVLLKSQAVNLTHEPRGPSVATGAAAIPWPLWISWPNGSAAVEFVPDATALRRHPPALAWNDTTWRQQCARRDDNFVILTQKVVVDHPPSSSSSQSFPSPGGAWSWRWWTDAAAASSSTTTTPATPSPPIKIMCVIYTHQGGHAQASIIRETWGSQCDGFFMSSDVTDLALNAYRIPHTGPEAYNNMWQKVRSMWAFVYDHYYDQYDWFHMGGDDMFVVVNNLRSYLQSEEIQHASRLGGRSEPPSEFLGEAAHPYQYPLYVGRRMAWFGDRKDMYNSGGPGYTLNKAALKLLVLKGPSLFYATVTSSMEDVYVARTLRAFGVWPYPTQDENGGERYMQNTPEWHFRFRKNTSDSKYNYYRQCVVDIKEGLDHFAVKSVAFHVAKGDEMRRFFVLVTGLCPKNISSTTMNSTDDQYNSTTT